MSDHRTRAQELREDAAESFERCEEDGFVSQYASRLSARRHDLAAEIEERGGTWQFPALFDTDGNLVAAKLVHTRFGLAFGLLPDDDPHGSFTGWFNPSQAKNPATRYTNDTRKGFVVGYVEAPAKAELAGGGKGTAGMMSVNTIAKRTDRGFSRDVTVVADRSWYHERN